MAPNPVTGSLFLDAGQGQAPANRPEVIRSRRVRINQGLLLDAQGGARSLEPQAEIILNLFPDTTYTAVLDQMQQEGDAYTWVGHLKGVETSEFTLVYAAGVFAGHFASPGSVYELSSAGGELYQIVQIDQQKLPGGEGDAIPMNDM